MSALWIIAKFTLAPPDTVSLTIFYLFWIVLFLFINISWDIATPNTPSFHIESLKGKINVVHHGVAFCSSLLVVVSLLNPAVREVARDTMVPLLIAGISGMLLTIPALCPYSPRNAERDAVVPIGSDSQESSVSGAAPVAEINSPDQPVP